jgi:membrane protease subunit (stomatin/prohibitin family)
MYGRGPFWGGPYMRRRGFPLLFPMGGFGMGMGMGGSLLGDLAAGGIGYLMGRQSAQQAPQYQAPQYQPPQAPQYQAPQYQPPANQQAPAASGGNERVAQLQLLGHLRDSGLLTNDEFEAEKRKILQG